MKLNLNTKSKYIIIGILICLAIFFAIKLLSGEKNKKVYYNNHDMEITAIKQKGTYYLPLNEIVEQIHFKVTNDESTKAIKVYDNVDTATVNSNGELTSDGVVVDTKCIPIVIDGETYVPLTFFSKGLGFDVTKKSDKIEMYGKNMYRLVVSNEFGDDYLFHYIQVCSKDYVGEITARMPIPSEAREDIQHRISVYRTKNENDVVEYYEYQGENNYPLVVNYYNKGYLAMEYDHEGQKSYEEFIMSPEKIPPTQVDFEYYAKPLEDRVAIDGDTIAFVDLVAGDERNRIYVWDDREYSIEKSIGICFTKYFMYYAPQDTSYSTISDHSSLDRVVRILSIKDNQLKCAVRTITGDLGETRESTLTINKDGTVTEKLEKPKNYVTVTYNGEVLDLGKTGALLLDGSVYMPLRAFSQELGYKVGWDDRSKSTSIKNDTVEIYIDMDGNTKINGVESVTDKTPKNIENSTYVPLRFISEAFGIKVNWDSATKTVDMKN